MSAEAPRHVAIDLGASGGRVACGLVTEGVLDFEIVHRFPNRPVRLGRHLYWDVLRLWQEIRDGLRKVARGGAVASLGVTTWGVDYALLDADRLPLGMVHCYRDQRTKGAYDLIAPQLPREAIYAATGIQFLPINTLPQLVAARQDAPRLFDHAAHLLMLPDLVNFWLTGRIVAEHTNASTTQLYDPLRHGWAEALIAAAGFDRAMFPELVEPGTVLGPLLPEIAADTGLQGAVVVAPATHDTASAVAAIPAADDLPWSYVSSGTWCLTGIEVASPVLTAAAREANVTNEQGVRGTTRLLRNTSGLFLLQESMRGWGDPPIEALLAAAAEVMTDIVIDAEDPLFLQPGMDMPARIARWCAAHGLRAPDSEAETTRVILNSLGEGIARTLRLIDQVAGRRSRVVHVVGGGSRMALLNQAIADAVGLDVVAGPVEATTSGNLLLQAEALGVIPVGDAREVMRRSTALERYAPRAEA